MSSSKLSVSWLAQAIEDLEAAKANFEQGRHALACFLCHESAVKVIKSFLYKQGAEMVWGEHLSDLCEDAMAFDPSFDFVKSVASLLDKHALATRNGRNSGSEFLEANSVVPVGPQLVADYQCVADLDITIMG